MNKAKRLVTQAFKAVDLSGSKVISYEGNENQIRFYLEKDYIKFHATLTYGTATADMALDISTQFNMVKNNLRAGVKV